MRKGKIKFINLKSKFGFIKDIDTGEEFYFKSAELRSKDPDMNAVFTFSLKDSKRGPEATQLLPEETDQ